MSKYPTLEIRNVRFKTEDSIPKFWHGGRRSVSIFFDGLSIFFPLGERWFIQSVKQHAHLVKDETLLKDIRSFMGQEGVHSREHDTYNKHLQRQGYPVPAMEKRIDRILKRAQRLLPKRWNLSATCALEHWTAILANALLSNPELIEGAHPEMTALWKWHAAEETEHKAVAFDVYKKAGAPYAERAFIQIVATIIFNLKILEHQARLMHENGILLDAKEWAELVEFLFFKPGGMFQVWRDWLEYFRPGFHPWDQENSQLLRDWIVEYTSSPVYKRAS